MPLSPTSRRGGRVRKAAAARKVRVNRIKVLSVLQNVMAAATSATATTSAAAGSCSSAGGTDSAASLDTTPNEFYSTGRVGRRNALPDILNQQHTLTSSADLPDQLSALTTRGSDEMAGASGSSAAASTSAEAAAHSTDGCKS